MDNSINMLAGILQDQKPVANYLSQNAAYAMPPPVMQGGYQTKLSPLDEMAFQQWVKANNVPFDPSPTADYDMRGFYKALKTNDPRAATGMNANDGMMHFTDYFKTPYHQSFSEESKYTSKGAPRWNDQDQLELPSGKIVYDEKKDNK